jgi:hypothetical protein
MIAATLSGAGTYSDHAPQPFSNHDDPSKAGGGLTMSQPSLYPECSHVMPSGRNCQSPARRGGLFCIHHGHRHALAQANRARNHSVALPPLEDRAAIQMSIDAVLAAMAAHKISRREAATCLFAIQLASQNLARMEQNPSPDPASPAPVDQEDESPARASIPRTREPATCAQRTPTRGLCPPQPAGNLQQLPQPGCAEASPELVEGSPAPGELEDQDPTLASPQGLLLDDRDTSGTHEYDPEPPLPLTAKQLREQRKRIEAHLSNYRAARAHYAAMPASTPGENPALVLAYVQNAINQCEAELQAIKKQEAPDPS